MRIREIVTTVVGTPWRELTFVELVADDGRRGLAEVRMVNKTDTLLACIHELGSRYVVDSDPFDVERLAWQIGFADYGRPGEVVQSALAAFDTACWDLIGQELGRPVWQLLGGGFRERVPAYANGWYQAERDPAAIAELAAGVTARGYRGLKLDPFGAASRELPPAELRRAVGIVAAVREAVGPDVALMIEMHGRFTGAVAAAVAAELEPFAPEWLEEPVPPTDLGGFRRVRAATRLPIATGERVHELAGFRELIEAGVVDVVQADLTHFGGFTGMRKLAGWAEAYNLALAPHNVCGPVGTAAMVHFAVATPGVTVLEHFNDFADAWVSGLVDAAPAVGEDGCFGAPDAPGLGLRLDRDACAEHPRTRRTLSLFEEGWERRGE
ncbi:MAG TPA: mandelate racemase/muconate lactonizing enzyme family protein [Gaiellaceae bacterium]|nr:mandelate racemase/muconate lactonizing enzyme family protein [Gaiellaceae bacterium]